MFRPSAGHLPGGRVRRHFLLSFYIVSRFTHTFVLPKYDQQWVETCWSFDVITVIYINFVL
jgi:hypothetical protein